ncbi:MAG: PEP-CTERM sorting domain-containing protein [Spirulinaceae cyanobacterium]
MQAKQITGFVAVTVASSTIFWVAPAEAINLKDDYPDFFNHVVSSYVQDERVPVANAADHKLDGAFATGDAVDIFFVDKAGAWASYANRLQYSINGTTQLAFDGRRVDDSNKQVAEGEGFSVNTQKGDTVDFSIWTKGWWDDPSNPGFILGSDESQNVDGKQHIVAYSEIFQGESWIFLGFEDIPELQQDANGLVASEKPDWDYNDAFLAIRGVSLGGDDPESVPEPASLLGLLAIAGAGVFGLRRKA